MKKFMFIVVIVVLMMGVVNVFAESNLFEDAHANANTMKQEHLAARKYFASEAAAGEKSLFENAHVDGNEMRAEQIAQNKILKKVKDANLFENAHNNTDSIKQDLLAARKHMYENTVENKEQYENAHNNADVLKAEQLASRKYLSENENAKFVGTKAKQIIEEQSLKKPEKIKTFRSDNTHNDTNSLKQEQLRMRNIQ